MTLARRIIWGLLQSTWAALCLSVAVLLLSAFERNRSDIASLGGLPFLLVAYFAVSVLAGITLGLLRPLAQKRYGVRLISSIVTAECVGSFFSLLTFRNPPGPHGIEVVLVMAGAAVVGALMAPLWTNDFARLSRPDFDAWLNRHPGAATSRRSSSSDRQGAA